MKSQSIVHVLKARARQQPDRRAYSILLRTGASARAVTYEALDGQARATAAELQAKGLQGKRAVLLLPPGADYIGSFFGCLYAGVTAVPCYPPGLTRASSDTIVRVANDCGAAAVLTSSRWLEDPRMTDLLERCKSHPLRIATDALDARSGDRYISHDPEPRDTAFLQYTSGSTGDPKGVIVSHGNVAANLSMIQASFGLTERDRICLWLPPYHDMGLIGGVLAGIQSDSETTLMEPAAFMRAPLQWLETISSVRATVTGAPNFAFDHCVRTAREQPDALAKLDLGCVEIAFCGAEMIRPATLRAFAETFAPAGFREGSFMPCYGMAETTLLCSTRPRSRGYVTRTIDRQLLEREGRVASVPRTEAGRSWTLVGCGSVISGSEVLIVHPETRTPVAEGHVGEVWIRGESVARGYFGRDEINREVFDQEPRGGGGGGFMRTGDRGFMQGPELYITGRLKDMLIVRGRNHAPEDIEGSVARSHAAVRPHRVVAASIERGDSEQFAVLIECDRKALASANRQALFEEVLASAHAAVVRDHGLVADVLAIVKSGDLPATTSGKVQRRQAGERYRRGDLSILATFAELTIERPTAKASVDVQSLTLDMFEKHTRRRPELGRKIIDLGIDSVTATGLAAEISDTFDLDLPPSVLSPESTVSDVVAYVNLHVPARSERSHGVVSTSPARAKAALDSRVNLPPPRPITGARDETPALSPQELMTKKLPERLRWHRDQVDGLRQSDVLNYNLIQQEKIGATDARVDGRVLTFFSSYSYLGLNNDEQVIDAKLSAIRRYGTGSHGVMLLGGYTKLHEELERSIARNFRTDETLLYSSGFAANTAIIDSLVKGNDTVFCDMLVHTSILDGCRLSGAQTRMFPHQDVAALERMLQRTSDEHTRLVIVDGVYSLRGEIAALADVVAVAHRYGAIVMVDEAHALGAIGRSGRGTAEHHGVEGQVDIVTGGLGKGIPAYGGYVTGRRELIDYLRFRSNPYVFSGGMDVANVAAANKAMELMESDASIMRRLRGNIALMQELLVEREIPSLRWGSPCMPVICRDAAEAHLLSRKLRDQGLYIAPITYPAVPKDQQGLRLTVTAAHSPDQLRYCIDRLEATLHSIRRPLSSTSQREATMTRTFTPIPEALEAFANGRFVLVSDDEDRENEGDLVIAGDFVTPEAINFMISHGKGLVCLAITPEIATQNALEPMVRKNRDHLGTAFTVSVDGTREHGITTGISASERAKTIELILSSEFGPSSLAAPGHIFPLVARAGGVRERPGHTEAGVELARLAGCRTASAAIVEVIKEDGEMARRDDLFAFADKFGLPYITIAQLKAYLSEQPQRTAARAA